MRGDWQIIDWLFAKVPNHAKEKVANSLSVINRWKIFDNLRRALLPIANIFALLAAWFVSSDPIYWTVFIVLIIFLPTISLSK